MTKWIRLIAGAVSQVIPLRKGLFRRIERLNPDISLALLKRCNGFLIRNRNVERKSFPKNHLLEEYAYRIR